MAKVSRDTSAVNARIVYWGIEGAGKTANLHAAFAKLRPDHRGNMRSVPSRLDPTVTYEVLPIALGEIAGIRTQIEMVAVPGAPEQAPTRKQLLDEVDGVVFVVDCAAERTEENIESLRELREALAAYGRSIEEFPLVIQYNKRDLTDPYALEDLHRKLDPGAAAVFEAVASEGTGVLQALSTISKRVIRALREQSPGAALAPDAPEASPSERMEQAILQEAAGAEPPGLDDATDRAAGMLHRPWEELGGEIQRPPGARLGRDLTIVSVGEATRVGDRSVRLPLVLGDAEGGTSTIVLTLQLDALVDETPG